MVSIRKEASGIPHLLVAPKRQIGPRLPRTQDDEEEGEVSSDDDFDRNIYEEGVGDARGWYEDGAYIARADEQAQEASGDEYDDGSESGQLSAKSIHQAYFASVIAHFKSLRRLLNASPPEDAVSSLTSDQPTFAEYFGPASKTKALWTRLLKTTDPNPAQLAQMDKDSVLRIIRVMLEKDFLARGYPITERTSRWIYALLARLPDRWELTHVENGWLRDLGKRAILLGVNVSEMAALRENVEDDALDAPEKKEIEQDSIDNEEAMDESLGDEQDYGKSKDDAHNLDANKTVMDGLSDVDSEIDPEAAEEGEVDESEAENEDDEGVPMELASQCSEDECSPQLLEAKNRLLAQLADSDNSIDAEMSRATQRSRKNARATLTMIITVVGELYGQRDLLEFRKPFVDL